MYGLLPSVSHVFEQMISIHTAPTPSLVALMRSSPKLLNFELFFF